MGKFGNELFEISKKLRSKDSNNELVSLYEYLAITLNKIENIEQSIEEIKSRFIIKDQMS